MPVGTALYVQTRVYRIVGTGLDVHTRVYRFARTDLYAQTRTYRLVGTDLYAQTRVYRIVGTDLHEQAHAHGGSVSRAIPHFNDYNRKKLIPTIGPRGDPLKICWYCVFTAIVHESAMGDLCTYSRAFRGYTNQKLENGVFCIAIRQAQAK